MKLQFVWWDEQGQRHHADGTGSFPIGQSKCLKPGEANIPAGAAVSLYAFVVWGSDNTAAQVYEYDPASNLTPNYVITGTTLDNQLGLMGVEECNSSS